MGVTACSKPNPTDGQMYLALKDHYGIDDTIIQVCVVDKLDDWTPSERRRIVDGKRSMQLDAVVAGCVRSGG
jgi:hypothetical protein